ncbi:MULTISPECIES: hypothetical protein [Sphingobacterium]|uniref:hypothetical protein n=1 Tax=Sphingobacterium TaxID=28453 RepID=UPI000ECC74B8|nr:MULTISPECIES: hypothetical protein [Sphingobacterium]HAL51833.1 hypothetical protein [Sphingobacterium sp.]HCX55005.1 hypothetical protein [Sphingobacterium sp.]
MTIINNNEMASVLLLHPHRISRRGAPAIFSTLVKGLAGSLEQYKIGTRVQRQSAKQNRGQAAPRLCRCAIGYG